MKNQSSFKKGHKHKLSSIRKISKAHKGKKLSNEHRKKISNSLKGKKAWNKGLSMPEYVKEKISRNRKGKPSSMGMLGKKVSEKTKLKMSLAHKGEKSYLWKGGISTYERKLWHNNHRRVRKLGNGGSHTQGEWELLKIQYNLTCPACKKQEPKIILSVDHIISLKNGGSDNIDNIQPLCRSCNSIKNSKNKKYEI